MVAVMQIVSREVKKKIRVYIKITVFICLSVQQNLISKINNNNNNNNNTKRLKINIYISWKKKPGTCLHYYSYNKHEEPLG